MTFEVDEALPGLVQRLEVALSSVDVALQKKEDARLIERLEQGTYTQEDLDTLFTEIEVPFRYATVVWTGGLWTARGILPHNPKIEDPVHQLAFALIDGEAAAHMGIDVSGSGDLESDSKGHRGRALAGLVRRLANTDGLDHLRALALNAWQGTNGVIDESEILIEPYQPSSQDEVDRLLRLVAPLERDHPIPLLMFLGLGGEEMVQSRKPMKGGPNYESWRFDDWT